MNFQLVHEMRFHPQTEIMQLLSPRGFVDTGVEMPIGGRVYLSENVVNEAARLFGYITSKEADKLRDRIAELEELNASRIRHHKERDPVFQALKAVMSEENVEVPA